MWANILQGAIGGAVFAFTGYAKNQKKDEGFDFFKFGTSIVVAAVIGGIAGYAGMEYGAVADMTLAGGFGLGIENLFKAVKRNYFA